MISDPLIRKNRSSRNFPSLVNACRSRLVALTNRTSVTRDSLALGENFLDGVSGYRTIEKGSHAVPGSNGVVDRRSNIAMGIFVHAHDFPIATSNADASTLSRRS